MSDSSRAAGDVSRSRRHGVRERIERCFVPKRSWVRISQIRTLSVERIGRRLARASEEEVDRVVEGLNEIIG